MAFTTAVTKKIELQGGLVMEKGTFTNTGGDTGGTITADVADTSCPSIVSIDQWNFASDGDHAVLPAKDVNPNQCKITCTANDTGDYTFIGPAA